MRGVFFIEVIQMNKPLQGICDNCKQVTKISFKMSHHLKGIQETYFECDHCEKHYTCFVTDDKVRMLQTKKDRLKGDRHISDRLKLQDEINERMLKLKSELIT